MTSRTFALRFAGKGDVQLVETRFCDAVSGNERISVRGKTAGAFKGAGTFQWTSAVRGLCLLFVKAALAHRYPSNGNTGHIVGFQSSLAASLDYAITKQPFWIRDMFGLDSKGNTLAQRLIARTNPNRKRPGPVILGLNERALPCESIDIRWNGEKVEQFEALHTLLLCLGETEHAAVSEEAVKYFVNKIAA